MIATHELATRGRLAAGIDVGGTNMSIVVTDDQDRLLFEYVEPTIQSALVDQIVALFESARRQVGQDIVGVRVAIPGRVDPEHGSVTMAVNLGITNLSLGPLLEEA